MNILKALSPLDGRYWDQLSELSTYFSEYGWMKYRVLVEVEYLIELCELPLPQLKGFDKNLFPKLRQLYLNFPEDAAARIKEIEKNTNHDIKAVEYFIKEALDKDGLGAYREFVHFGLTSQDINNTAIPLLLKEALENAYYPQLNKLIGQLETFALKWMDVPMLARTHGQPASPTRLGKEILVFVERLKNQLKLLQNVPHAAKFGGATGNFNAHQVTYPQIDWIGFANRFLERLGLNRSQTTTQIEHYDHLCAQLDAMKRINTILIDLARDCWQYISMNYFSQKINKNETGSSAMPHKVNPIDFENAEGNLGVANALFEFLSAKLPVSRLQRDLTDSTVLRNLGVPFAHSMLSFLSLEKGLNKIELNAPAIEKDLADNWAVVAEALQSILRREALPNAYELLKEFSRKNEKMNREDFLAFINSLELSESVKEELRAITPFNYLGVKPDV